MGKKRSVYSGSEYKGFVVLDEPRIKKGKVTAFYAPILDGVHSLGVAAVEGKMVRPSAVMLSFAFTDAFADYDITAVVDRIRHTFRKVRKRRKKASTFKVGYLWVRETKYLTPSDPEFIESLSASEKRVYRSSMQDDCPIPYPHYHMILILDSHKGGWLAVKLVMQRLVNEGIVRAGFHFSENNNSKKKELDLRLEPEFSDYIYRGSYLAKTDTKDLSQKRLWSMSQIK